MQVDIVKDGFSRNSGIELGIAKAVLQERGELLIPINEQFVLAQDTIIDLHNYHLQNPGPDPPRTELPDGKTRLLCLGLIGSLQKFSYLWPHMPVNDFEELPNNKHFRFFSLVLNKYKVLSNGKFKPKRRDGTLGGLPISYATHTHADLEIFMKSFKLGSSNEAFSLAVGHDLEEEGQRLVLGSNDHHVDATYLIDKYPENNLGLFWAIGIPTLTESKYDVMKKAMNASDQSLLTNFRESPVVTSTLEESLNGFHQSHDINKIKNLILHSHLEFGGLALQIKPTINRLREAVKQYDDKRFKLSKEQLESLAKSLIEVELSDRMSDIAELDRFIGTYKNPPQFARHRTIFQACRMLNMYEKLSEEIEKASWTDDFTIARDGFIGVIRAKLIDANQLLLRHGEKAIDDDELISFYYTKFRPVQLEADKAMTLFIENKVKNILTPLYF